MAERNEIGQVFMSMLISAPPTIIGQIDGRFTIGWELPRFSVDWAIDESKLVIIGKNGTNYVRRRKLGPDDIDKIEAFFGWLVKNGATCNGVQENPWWHDAGERARGHKETCKRRKRK